MKVSDDSMLVFTPTERKQSSPTARDNYACACKSASFVSFVWLSSSNDERG